MKNQHRTTFRLLTAIQVVLLVLSSLVFSWSLFTTSYVAVPLLFGFVIVLQLIGLLRYVESHVDTLEDFFAAVNYEDFTRKFVENDVDAELKGAFNKIIEKFQHAHAERALQAVYLDTVVRHVPVPFIAAKADGTVTLMNNPAKRLIGAPSLTDIAQLGEIDPTLPQQMRSIEAGEQRLLQAWIRGIPVELRVSVSEIRLEGGAVERLYSIENLSGELTAREASAWRNLIRVLTHEIMNTLTPVASLAQSTSGLLDDVAAKDDIREAVETIARRSEGLMSFVQRYRELLNVPQPVMTTISVQESLQNVAALMKVELNEIDVSIDVQPNSLEVSADAGLLEQVLLNLVRNAYQAIEGQASPCIVLTGQLQFGRTVISVSDNGPGIVSDMMDEIFVPFFTTKRDGSGIGLSLSRQIMSAHGGEIVASSTDSGTTMKLVF